ncbi:MAG: penicillin acylase family protein [Vicinamibacteria bacterium]
MASTPAPNRLRRAATRIALFFLVAVPILAAGLWLSVRASLPLLDGGRALAGLRAPVTVTRDSLGIPTVLGSDRVDVARALGFLHGQDRFFQMDLLRRRAAGELAALVGRAALPLDRAVRTHRLRERARRSLEQGEPGERELIAAYTAGANAGLAALGARPFEYLALRAAPEPWREEDSLLVAFAMYLDLNDENGADEAGLGLLRDTLPPALFAFLTPLGTEWDAPVEGRPFAPAPIPGPDVLDLRAAPARRAGDLRVPGPGLPASGEADGLVYGSNNWALAGARSSHGGALLADDMHLGINVPNIWYRASLAWQRDGQPWRVTGVTLPGTPMTIAGSNGQVAWGFTNSQGDWTDVVVVETEPGDAASYRTPEGPRRFELSRQTIAVAGGPPESVEIRETIYGPLVGEDVAGRPLAVRWIGHDPGAANLGLVRVELARDLDEALRSAAGIGAPPQNFVCADRAGRIGWTIMGRIPRRVGFEGRLPESWADGTKRWDGYLAPEEFPRIVDPPQGRIWTANARVVDGEKLKLVGHGGYDLGARQGQIRDDLARLERASERDLLAVQLDDRAVFLERWQKLLAGLLAREDARDPRRSEARRLVEAWGGRAAVDSVGYRLVRQFRLAVAQRAFSPLVAATQEKRKGFDYLGVTRLWEGPLWALVSQRPLHLLSPRYASWDALLGEAFASVLDDASKDGQALAAYTWGARNTARIQHPLARALPALSGWLDMPRDPLPGDSHMPRVASPGAGASERMVVSPGREEQGLFHMPGGQSGHPLSPYYRNGHAAWLRGEPTPFLPGPAVHTLILQPETNR